MKDTRILSWVLQEDQVSEVPNVEGEVKGPRFVQPREEKVVGDLMAAFDYRGDYEKFRLCNGPS